MRTITIALGGSLPPARVLATVVDHGLLFRSAFRVLGRRLFGKYAQQTLDHVENVVTAVKRD